MRFRLSSRVFSCLFECESDDVPALASCAQYSQAEAGEEFIAIQLMRKLRALQSEKHALAVEVEREEEFLTNNLTKQLVEARQQKVDLENQLEAEQESIVHRLQRQIQQYSREKRCGQAVGSYQCASQLALQL